MTLDDPLLRRSCDHEESLKSMASPACNAEHFGFYSVKGQADGPEHLEPKPSMEMSGAVVCGVLSKFVNRFKGWEARLFVLDNCHLKYFKVIAVAPVVEQGFFR